MTIYEKLQRVRVALQNESIKKSGKNSFAGYDYYELKDFLPSINRICLENGITTIIDFSGAENITLAIIDFEKPDDKILFYSPRTDAAVKGAQTIQNLGATETYQRRYLYLMAFEIAESDTVDATQGKEKNTHRDINQPNKQSEPASNELRSQILAESKAKGIQGSDISAIIKNKYGVHSSKELTMSQAVDLKNNLEKFWKELVALKGKELHNSDDDAALDAVLDSAMINQ